MAAILEFFLLPWQQQLIKWWLLLCKLISTSFTILQSKIEQVLQGIPMVVCRVDNILVSGKTDQEHLQNLAEVLASLENAGLRLKLAKCKSMQPSVEYLGYRVDADGLHAIDKKFEAIRNAPAPTN